MARGVVQRLFVFKASGGPASSPPPLPLPAEGPHPQPASAAASTRLDNAPPPLPAARLATADSHPTGARSWAERHGGWILSVAFHLVLVCFLAAQYTPLIRRPEPQRPRLVWLALQPPEIPLEKSPPALEARVAPTPPPTEPDNPEPPLQTLPARPLPASAPDPAQPASAPPAQQAKPAFKFPTNPARPGSISLEQGKRIAGILEKYGGGPDDLNKSVDSALQRVDSRLMKAEVTQAAAPFLDKAGAGGAGEGPIRTFTFGRADPAAEKGVMTLYGIGKTRRHVRPSSSGSFLSGVSGGNGEVYQPAPREGDYEVIEVPQRAQQQMAQLEHQWLVQHGYSPRSTRVVSVEFGVVKQGNTQWDLGILDIKVQAVETGASPKKP